MNGYKTVKDMALEWDVSERIIQLWCKQSRIDGVIQFGGVWAIPANAKKPTRTVNQKPGRKPKTTGNQHQ